MIDNSTIELRRECRSNFKRRFTFVTWMQVPYKVHFYQHLVQLVIYLFFPDIESIIKTSTTKQDVELDFVLLHNFSSNYYVNLIT